MRIGPHKHRCDDCKRPTECCGQIEQNFDGFPEWICREYHTIERSGDVELRGFLCDECGEKAAADYAADLADNV
jgi:hypothetical protein